jgi:DNA-binding beta-propeller fold protein YncE
MTTRRTICFSLIGALSLIGFLATWHFGFAQTSDPALAGIFGGDIAPIRILRDPYSTMAGIAVDAENDEVHISDENRSSIMTFRRTDNSGPRQGEPLRQIIGPRTSLEFICGITVDPRRREVYGVNNDVADNMVVFGPDQTGDSPPRRELKVDHGAWGVALDEQNEEVAITIEHINKVSVYRRTASGEELPLRIIQGPRTGLADPHGIFIDSKNNEIYVINIGAWHAVRTGETEINGVPDWWRAFDPTNKVQSSPQFSLLPSTGRYYPPSITVYPRTGNGDVPPKRTIQGDRTQLSNPLGMYVDWEHNEVVVANDGGDSVLVFSTSANGNAAPMRVLKGAATGIKFPSGVWVDTKNDELWVTNWGNHSTTVYPRTAQGNVRPLRVIRSAPEGTPLNGMGNPSAMVYDAARDELLIPN